MRLHSFASGCLCFLTALCTATGAEPDAVRSKIDKAHAIYEADVKKAQDDLIKTLQNKLESARKITGNRDQVKKVEAELDLFTSQGVIPESVDTQIYKATVRSARSRFITVLKEAEKEYTKAGNTDAAELVRDDLLRVQSDAAEERSAELAKAVAGYHKARAAARESLLKGFTTAIDRAAIQKADPARLQLEQQVFERGGRIPWTETMRPYLALYEKSLNKAEHDLRATYLREIERATRAKDKARAEQLRADMLSAIEIKVVAAWRHQAGDDTPQRIRLYSNGRIDDPNGTATWSFTNGILVLRWPNPKAPNGAFVDTCNVSDDGTAYRGKNQNRTKLSGTNLMR